MALNSHTKTFLTWAGKSAPMTTGTQ